MTLKALIKSVVPRSCINFARDLQGKAKLSAVSTQTFEPANLKAQQGFSPDAIFNDKILEPAFNEDHALIAKAIGGENRLDGVNPGDRRAIYYLIAGMRPKLVLEVGTHIAASSFYIAAALKRTGGHMKTVDILDVNNPHDAPWIQAGYAMPPVDYIRALGLQDRIDFIKSPATDFMAGTKDRFDFIFLDGDHYPDAVYREVAAALKILNPGGIILLHDYYPDAKPLWADDNVISGPFRALDRIRRENANIIAAPLGNLPWPTKQGSHVTSLALVLKT